MSFFKKERSGPATGKDCKKGCGIAGADASGGAMKFMIDGAGPQAGYEQNVVKRSGSKL